MKLFTTITVIVGTVLCLYFFPRITLSLFALLAIVYYIVTKVIVWDIGRDHLRPQPRDPEKKL